MKSALTSLFFACLSLFIYSCKPEEKGTLAYETLRHDTDRITIFKWDTIGFGAPNNSFPLPLTQEDLFVVDSILTYEIDSFNRATAPKLYWAFGGNVHIDSFVIVQTKYKYQLVPYEDVNGQRIITIIGFNDNFNSWKTRIYFGKQHYGMKRMELTINLSDKTCSRLQTGDFG